MNAELERIKSIKSFPSLVKYLREELEWKIDDADIDDLTFDYTPDELFLDKETAVKIKQIKQLRPLVSNQPWGIFYLSFEPKRLPIVALRRILRSLVIKTRQSANPAQMATWEQNDLLFISSYGEHDNRELTFAHFSDNTGMGDLPTLKVLGWNAGNTDLRLEATYTTLQEKLHWPDNDADVEKWREQWSSAFKLQYRETVRTSKDLATHLAELAKVIRKSVNEVLKIETEKGELRKLYKAFQEALIHDLTEDDFADMYAQTIAYGLLSARISRTSGALVADNLSDLIPNTNPFLKELMQTFLTVGGRKSKIDFDELGINEVVELLRNANMEEVLKDFGAKNPNEDPVIHFYELFLREYDPEKRMKRGVFYTPRPVVSFIVRSVDEILRNEFGLVDGLADITTWGEMKTRNKDLVIPEGVKVTAPFVQILDPATGTGTFLVEVIDLIYKTVSEKWRQEEKTDGEIRELWNEYVPEHLLPRLYGFELMMAPYSIAHMKIGLRLRETGYSFISSERAQIYLTNTLEEPKDFSGYFATMAPALAHEAEAANRVKRLTPITVVIGNPPYSAASSTNSPWIMDLIKDYKEDVAEQESQIRTLSDDYVKFIRVSQRLVTLSGVGVVGMITNSGFTDGAIFRGMRHRILNKFNDLCFLDLHGHGRRSNDRAKGAVDENVFDILVGTVISLLVKQPGMAKRLRRADLIGSREHKYKTLTRFSESSLDWNDIQSQPPYYLFQNVDLDLAEEYDCGIPFLDFWGTGNESIDRHNYYGFGIKTQQDEFAIAFDRQTIIQRIRQLLEPSTTEVELRRDFRLCKTNQWSFETARRRLPTMDWHKRIVRVLYRPFDNRWTCYVPDVVTNPRPKVMSHLLSKNLAMLTSRQVGGGEWRHISVSNHIPDNFAISLQSKEGCHVFPLFSTSTSIDQLENQELFESSRRDNLNLTVANEIAKRLGLVWNATSDGNLTVGGSVGPEDVFNYVYAVLHSPTYRSRYKNFLRIDFAKVPLTTDMLLFARLCNLGADLVALHLLEGVDIPRDWTLKTDGSTLYEIAEVGPGFPKYEAGEVFINKTSWLSGVEEEVWNFHIGGYQVCHKWLKDRKGRTLSDEDIAHYGKITVSLRETIRLMGEIDEVIKAHGGFPLPGSMAAA